MQTGLNNNIPMCCEILKNAIQQSVKDDQYGNMSSSVRRLKKPKLS